MTENEKFIYESVFNQVRMGFLPLDEIKENILEEIIDNEFEGVISEKWAYELINSEYIQMVEESKNWKKPTDTDLLIKAFDELCKRNIVALHNAGYTTSDGEYEVVQVEASLREEQVISDGYCFYHEQDLTRAISIENPSLYIAFQKVNNYDDKVTLEVGRKVVKVLKEIGFEVDWNENPQDKILIPNFKWQRLYDDNNRDLQDYDHTAELMLQKKQRTFANVEQVNRIRKSSTEKSFWVKIKNMFS